MLTLIHSLSVLLFPFHAKEKFIENEQFRDRLTPITRDYIDIHSSTSSYPRLSVHLYLGPLTAKPRTLGGGFSRKTEERRRNFDL